MKQGGLHMRDRTGRKSLTYLGRGIPVMLLLVIHHGVLRTAEGIRPGACESRARGAETRALDPFYPNGAVFDAKKADRDATARICSESVSDKRLGDRGSYQMKTLVERVIPQCWEIVGFSRY